MQGDVKIPQAWKVGEGSDKEENRRTGEENLVIAASIVILVHNVPQKSHVSVPRMIKHKQ